MIDKRVLGKFARSLAALAGSLVATASMAADVGVSVSIGQPGFYGRIDIGSFPAPAVIYPQPVVIAPAPVAIVQQPIDLRVPPGHAKNWARHCRHYNACGQRTYFVRDDWYRTVYAPAYHGHGHVQDRHRHGGPRQHARPDRHHGHGDRRGRHRD